MNNEFVLQLGTDIDESFFLIGVAILVIEILAGLFKSTLSWRGLADMLTNISTQIPFIIVQIFLFTATYAGYSYMQTNFIPWSFEASAITIALAVFVADFLYYWEHRIAHEIRGLWIHHAVHHSSRYMNMTTGVRFGAFEGVWSMFAMFPMVLLGFPAELIIFGSLVVLAYQTWIHTELINKLGPLEWVLNTPSHHRVHHGCDDEYVDKNYGGILIVWDRLFSTFKEEEKRPRYGLARDFDSVNPLKVWFSEFPQFFGDVLKSKSIGEAWSRIFNRPEWQPIESAPPNASSIGST